MSGTTPTIALLENLPDAVLLLDETGAIGYANAAAERLFGRPVAELSGKLLTSLLAEPFADEYASLIHRFGEGEPGAGARVSGGRSSPVNPMVRAWRSRSR